MRGYLNMPTEDKGIILAFLGAIIGIIVASKISGGYYVIAGAIIGAVIGYFLGSKQ